jgi:hypothetical protein
VPRDPLAPWKEEFTFLDSAEREFLGLPHNVQETFIAVFPEFARHPTRATADLDVEPLRDRSGRWRLKVAGGHRGIYRLLQGRPDFEMFQTRDEVYRLLRQYLMSRQK